MVVIIKTIVVATVVKGFGYTNKAALLVSSPNCLTRKVALVVEIPSPPTMRSGVRVTKGKKWRIPLWPLSRRVLVGRIPKSKKYSKLFYVPLS